MTQPTEAAFRKADDEAKALAEQDTELGAMGAYRLALARRIEAEARVVREVRLAEGTPLNPRGSGSILARTTGTLHFQPQPDARDARIAELEARLLNVRAKNAADMKRNGAVWEAYDRAVLDRIQALKGSTDA